MINSLFSLQKKTKVRIASNFFRRLSSDCMITFVTVFLVSRSGSLMAGFIVFIILILGMAANIKGGIAANKYEIRNLLIGGEILHAIILFCMAFSVAQSIYLFIFLYLVKNIVFSFIVPAGERILLDTTDEKNRKFVYQLSSALSGLATPLGLAIGAILYQYRFDYLILFSCLCSTISALIYFFGLTDHEESVPPCEKISDSELKIYKKVFSNKPALLIIMSAVLIYSVEFSFSQYLPVYLAHLSELIVFGEWKIKGIELYSFARSSSGIIALLISLAFIAAIKKYGSRQVMLNSMILFIVFSALTFIFSALPLLFVFSSRCHQSPVLFIAQSGNMNIVCTLKTR